MRDSQVHVDGQREIAYTDIGDPRAPCLFFFHGAPMSRLHHVSLEREFATQGLRVISPDRPGYGRSTPQPGRLMSDWTRDVTALADALGIGRFAVAGHSSGGPYAVACSALLADRITAGVVLAGVTDMSWPPAWDGYIESEAELMRMPDENAAIAWCTKHYGEDGMRFLSEPFDLPEPDVAFLADESAEQTITSTMVEAFRQGALGYAQDAFIQGRPWPFETSSIRAPIEVVHGELDTFIPIAHSRHTADVVASATFRTIAGHGLLTLITELPSIASAAVRSADKSAV